MLAAYPDVSVALHLDHEQVDLVGGGFGLALRVTALIDSSLRARCEHRHPLRSLPPVRVASVIEFLARHLSAAPWAAPAGA